MRKLSTSKKILVRKKIHTQKYVNRYASKNYLYGLNKSSNEVNRNRAVAQNVQNVVLVGYNKYRKM